jgi:succinate dehydrogenase / fumarate reductase membrane anchor subunit
MVKIATVIGKSGLQTWLIQRVSALIVGAYFIAVLIFWLSPNASFISWQGFVRSPFGQFCGLTTLVAMLIHTWIGFWTVTTDYIHALVLRLPIQLVALALLTFYAFWGIKIIWL